MSKTFNIYCDESCHLEKDHQTVMVIGAVWCEFELVRSISEELRAIKEDYGLGKSFEIKWVKVSPSRIDFYLNIIEYFFSNPNLKFRAVIIPQKDRLDHTLFHQTHDDWYYKMFFELLKVMISAENRYRIYFDIKDTRSGKKMEKLHEVLSNSLHDFDRVVIENLQAVRSHEVELIQLTDLLIGSIGYKNRGLETSSAKLDIVSLIQKRSNNSLTTSTSKSEKKFNLFRWTPSVGSK